MFIPAELIKAAAVIAPSKDVRYYLNGVRIQGRHLIASDGKRMFVYRLSADAGVDILLSGSALANATKYGIGLESDSMWINGARFEYPTQEAIFWKAWRRLLQKSKAEGVAQVNPASMADLVKIGKALKISPQSWHVQHRGAEENLFATAKDHPIMVIMIPMRNVEPGATFEEILAP